MAKQWFVVLQQEEVEAMKTGSQLLVYSAIKSYSANGKNEVDVSVRDIAGRSKLSIGKIHKTIPQVIKLGFIQVVGKKTRRGGSVPIYKVFTTRTFNPIKRSRDEQLNSESVHYGDLSVHNSGTKYIQSNKVNNTKDINGNNLKNTRAGSPKESTPGFGGLHWSEFADKLSDYHFSKEASKK